jgi:hypothetical protein
MTEVREDQFEIAQDRVVHRPTSAEFRAYPGAAEIHGWVWGRSGEVLPNGDCFDGGEIFRTAVKLLAERPSLKR